MTKSDYQLLAAHIKAYMAGMRTGDERREFLAHFIEPLCARLMKNNPAFDANLFIVTCGAAA